MTRRLHAAALVLCGLCLATGCGAPSTGMTELVIWSAPAGVEEMAFKRLCARFQAEHPGIRVHNVGALAEDKLVRAIVAGAPPDMAYVYNIPPFGALAANGSLEPLDRRFAATGFDDRQFLPGAIQQERYRGVLYGMPATRDSRTLYRNRACFRAAGLNPDQPPRDLDEMLRMARSLTRRGPDGSLESIGMLPPADPAVLFALFGGGLADPATGAITANRAENVLALTWLVRLVDDEGGYARVSAFVAGFAGDETAQNPLATGKIAMTIDGEWAAMHIDRYAPGTDYAVSELPPAAGRPDLRNVAWQDGDFLCIPAGSRHPDAAWQFIAWMEQPRQQLEYAPAMSNLPTVVSVAGSPRFTTGGRSLRVLGWVFRHIAADRRNARWLPTLPVTELYLAALHNACDRALYHQQSPASALADVQARVTLAARVYR